ncbi:hypothetical protein, partial [Plasmodium yoelii yoelii]
MIKIKCLYCIYQFILFYIIIIYYIKI